jgi:hypothetical protein
MTASIPDPAAEPDIAHVNFPSVTRRIVGGTHRSTHPPRARGERDGRRRSRKIN